MNQFNRYFSPLWGIFSVLSVLFWLILKQQFSLEIWVTYTEGMLLLYLIYNSRALRHKQAMFLWIALGMLCLAFMFKLLHYPFSFELTAIGTVATFISYYLFFLRYTQKKLLDTLKLIWIVSTTSVLLLRSINLYIPIEVDFLKSALLAFIFIKVAILEWNGYDQSELQEKENELPEDIL